MPKFVDAMLRTMKKTFFVLAAVLAGASAHAGCYTVLGPKGNVLSESSTPPVDMSYQLHQTVPYAYGQGATMVFGIADPKCGVELDSYYDLKKAQVVYEPPVQKARPAKKRARGAKRAQRSQRK